MRIAIDIDSTLHHYWDVLSEVSVAAFRSGAPLRGAVHLGDHRLREEQLALCIEESHSDEQILVKQTVSGRGGGGGPLA